MNMHSAYVNPDAATLNEHGPSTHQAMVQQAEQVNQDRVNAQTAAPQAAVELLGSYRQALNEAVHGEGLSPAMKQVQAMGPDRAANVMRLIYA